MTTLRPISAEYRPIPWPRLRPHDRQIRLSDGRRLGYSEYGDPHGRPVLFFHGFGTSRVICPPDDALARSVGARLIAVDRPGIGLSDPLPGRRLLDWPADVAQLANQLQLDRFAIGVGPVAVRTPPRVASPSPTGCASSDW